MSKTKKDEVSEGPVPSPVAPVEAAAPSNVDVAALQIQIAELKEANARLAAEKEAQKEVSVSAKKAERTGQKLPFALVQVIGNGRRLVGAGEALTEYECQGLTAGVHFETR